jgi:hypothetical protein
MDLNNENITAEYLRDPDNKILVKDFILNITRDKNQSLQEQKEQVKKMADVLNLGFCCDGPDSPWGESGYRDGRFEIARVALQYYTNCLDIESDG